MPVGSMPWVNQWNISGFMPMGSMPWVNQWNISGFMSVESMPWVNQWNISGFMPVESMPLVNPCHIHETSTASCLWRVCHGSINATAMKHQWVESMLRVDHCLCHWEHSGFMPVKSMPWVNQCHSNKRQQLHACGEYVIGQCHSNTTSGFSSLQKVRHRSQL